MKTVELEALRSFIRDGLENFEIDTVIQAYHFEMLYGMWQRMVAKPTIGKKVVRISFSVPEAVFLWKIWVQYERGGLMCAVLNSLMEQIDRNGQRYVMEVSEFKSRVL